MNNNFTSQPCTNAFIISAPASGCGKTTITMGLIAALRERGFRVQPFKTGPDYIDSAYHSRLAERTCINLDTWMTSPDFVRETFARHTQDADIAIIEGVMGLFDGAADGSGSAAGIAKLLNLPVLHVIDAGKAAQSAAATLYGLEQFDPELRSLGVVFNRIASKGHAKMVIDAMKGRCNSPYLGYLPKNAELALPERQLGLLSAHEHGLPADYIERLVDAVEEHIDIPALLLATDGATHSTPPNIRTAPPPTVRLGIAQDEAFCFYYQDNLDLLQQAGIQLIPFSPLNDTALPPSLNGLYLGGGFPEEFSEQLAQNHAMLDAIQNFNGCILAECGGLIYLTNLAKRINGTIEMTQKLQACGYREVTFNRNTILGPQGTILRGHEFHWSQWTSYPSEGFGALQTNDRAWGYADDRLLASYFHIHFGSNPETTNHLRRALEQKVPPAQSSNPPIQDSTST